MSITVYGLKQCDTCKKARAWLETEGVDYQFIDYREQPIAAEQLLAWAQAQGWTKVVNRASMTWRQLDVARKDPQNDAAWLSLVAEFPVLVRRPVIVSDNGVQFGFNVKKIPQLL